MYHHVPCVPPCAACTTMCRVYHHVPRVPPCAACTTMCRVYHHVPRVPPCAACTTMCRVYHHVLCVPPCAVCTTMCRVYHHVVLLPSCSAGVGRSGTFITVHSQLKRIAAEGNIDIYGFVRAMRYRRCLMVQTEAQYIFIHDALLEAVECGVTEIQARDLPSHYKKLQTTDESTGKTLLELELQVGVCVCVCVGVGVDGWVGGVGVCTYVRREYVLMCARKWYIHDHSLIVYMYVFLLASPPTLTCSAVPSPPPTPALPSPPLPPHLLCRPLPYRD